MVSLSSREWFNIQVFMVIRCRLANVNNFMSKHSIHPLLYYKHCLKTCPMFGLSLVFLIEYQFYSHTFHICVNCVWVIVNLRYLACLRGIHFQMHAICSQFGGMHRATKKKRDNLRPFISATNCSHFNKCFNQNYVLCCRPYKLSNYIIISDNEAQSKPSVFPRVLTAWE